MTTHGIALQAAVCHADNLVAAFARYARYRGLWQAGMPMFRVAKSPLGPMLALADALRCGNYEPGSPATFAIHRGDGTERTLSVYPIRDRIAQRALLNVLQARTDAAMSPHSYGFRPGRGVGMAVAAVRAWLDRGYLWVVDADISRCFDSIPRRRLLDAVAWRTGDDDAASWVARLMGWKSAADLNAIGIPQGAVLSPWLCNVYLWSLDDALQAAGVPLVRYADDFVAMQASESTARSALGLCRTILEGIGLRLHPVKTSLLRVVNPLVFLGARIEPRRLLGAPVAMGDLACC